MKHPMWTVVALDDHYRLCGLCGHFAHRAWLETHEKRAHPLFQSLIQVLWRL